MKCTASFVGLSLCLFACASCASREHMSEDFGRQSRTFLAQQRVSHEPAHESLEGVDTEEATAIRDRYQAGLGPEDKGRNASDNLSRVLVLEDANDAKNKR